ncbi:hypothetical protein AB1L30_17975 [Bremerella sp. JC817]|uniref:hypothetical protein n=1 Tax=Bremerella sp. JC817 TaxID=3231756 RepID=UPI003458516E
MSQSDNSTKPTEKANATNVLGDLAVLLALLFCTLVSTFEFCTDMMPAFNAWLAAARQCHCERCEAVERQKITPAPMPRISPPQIPLTPIQPPAI